MMKKYVLLLVALLSAALGYAQTEGNVSFKELVSMAKGGDAEAQFEVGACYYEGDGVKENHAAAAKWWKKAARGGVVEAQNNLGALYFGGDGVKEDDEEARKWWSLAAEGGCIEARYNLSMLEGMPEMSVKNERGNGVQR